MIGQKNSGRAAAWLLGLLVLLYAWPSGAHAQSLKSIAGTAEACGQKVKDDPRYAPLRQHSEENDTRYVTRDEIPLLIEKSYAVEACSKPLVETLDRTYPSLAVIAADGLAREQDNVIALLEKRETWGDYVRNKKMLAADLNRKMQAEVRRIQASQAPAAGSAPPARSTGWSGHFYRMASYGHVEKWDFNSDGTFLHEGIVAGGADVRGEERGTYILGNGWIELQIRRKVTAFTTPGSDSSIGAGGGPSSQTERLPFKMLGDRGSDGILLDNRKYNVRHGW